MKIEREKKIHTKIDHPPFPPKEKDRLSYNCKEHACKADRCHDIGAYLHMYQTS